MCALFLNPNLFFLVENDQILVWDYKNNDQYLLSNEYFTELLKVGAAEPSENRTILDQLQSAQLISTGKPDEEYWGWDIISKIFHFGTQDVYAAESTSNNEEIAANYLTECRNLATNEPSIFLEKMGKLIDLPVPNTDLLERISFFSTLKNRKTSRSFNGKPITLQELSLILYAGFGLIHGKEWDELDKAGLKSIGCRKASPASGALHAEEVYVFAYRIQDLEQGIYHYRPQDHKLTQLAIGDYEREIINANYNQFYSEGLACGIYLTCRFDKLWWKYKHSRALKVALLDLGHASQTFLLSTTALSLNTWITAAFQDSMVNKLLQVDGVKESAFLFLGVGHGTNETVPKLMKQLLG